MTRVHLDTAARRSWTVEHLVLRLRDGSTDRRTRSTCSGNGRRRHMALVDAASCCGDVAFPRCDRMAMRSLTEVIKRTVQRDCRTRSPVLVGGRSGSYSRCGGSARRFRPPVSRRRQAAFGRQIRGADNRFCLACLGSCSAWSARRRRLVDLRASPARRREPFAARPTVPLLDRRLGNKVGCAGESVGESLRMYQDLRIDRSGRCRRRERGVRRIGRARASRCRVVFGQQVVE